MLRVRNSLHITLHFRMERKREIKSFSLNKVLTKLSRSMFYNIETLKYKLLNRKYTNTLKILVELSKSQ